ncbi:hypothetical protein JHK85_045761 [Glycine max]|nr:hypothetical protein JHK85_045761 [Glycine max]
MLFSTFHILKSANDNETEIELQLIHSEDQDIGPSASDFIPSPKQVQFAPIAAPMYPYLFDESNQLILTPLSDLIHFNSVEAEEASFIPSWEEVCPWHPSLIENQRRRSPRFILWAFIALGRVLHFLKTKTIWDIASLEIELKKLKTKLVVAHVDLEVARRDFPEVEDDFRERDMDAELGYKIP